MGAENGNDEAPPAPPADTRPEGPNELLLKRPLVASTADNKQAIALAFFISNQFNFLVREMERFNPKDSSSIAEFVDYIADQTATLSSLVPIYAVFSAEPQFFRLTASPPPEDVFRNRVSMLFECGRHDRNGGHPCLYDISEISPFRLPAGAFRTAATNGVLGDPHYTGVFNGDRMDVDPSPSPNDQLWIVYKSLQRQLKKNVDKKNWLANYNATLELAINQRALFLLRHWFNTSNATWSQIVASEPSERLAASRLLEERKAWAYEEAKKVPPDQPLDRDYIPISWRDVLPVPPENLQLETISEDKRWEFRQQDDVQKRFVFISEVTKGIESMIANMNRLYRMTGTESRMVLFWPQPIWPGEGDVITMSVPTVMFRETNHGNGFVVVVHPGCNVIDADACLQKTSTKKVLVGSETMFEAGWMRNEHEQGRLVLKPGVRLKRTGAPYSNWLKKSDPDYNVGNLWTGAEVVHATPRRGRTVGASVVDEVFSLYGM